MKKLVVVLMAMGLFGTMPAFAANHGDMKMDMHEGMQMKTDEGMRQCALQAESIQQKIARLQAEVKAGKKSHNPEEVKKLEMKLKEANKILENLTTGP